MMRRNPVLGFVFALLFAFAVEARGQGDFALGQRETIVFTGDSITAAGHYVNYIDSYLRTRFPERELRVINSGKSSENLSGLCEADHPNNRRPCLFDRFTPAVSDFRPSLVVACYGINDGIYHPFGRERFAKYQAGVRRLIELTKQETGARLLLLTPPVYDSKNPGQLDERPEETYGYKRPFADYDQVMEKYAAWLKGMETPADVTVADLHTRMRNYVVMMRAGEPGFVMSKDGIHPGPEGHLVMAMTVLRAWNAPAMVDEAKIDAGTKKALAGDVKDLSVSGGAVEFNWTSKIPMPMDEGWTSRTLGVTRFKEMLNQYRLTVTGLPEGQYRLLADGREAGRFGSGELKQGIDLTALGERLAATARSRQILPLVAARRKMGDDAFRAGATDAPDPKLVELENQIRELCRPVKVKVRIERAG